jgi:hypothetical protein
MTKRIGVLVGTLVAVAATATAADDKILNGAACVSEGASIVDDSGARMSTATNSPVNRASTFVCPLVRDNNALAPFSLGVRINVRNATFQPSSSFKCTVRTVLPNAATVSQTQVFVPARSDASDDGFKSVVISPLTVALPDLSYVLFCSVPDVASGMRSGIISYKWGE